MRRASQMVISDLCPCGAQFQITAPSYANPEHQHFEWLLAHKVCRGKAAVRKGKP